MRVGVFRPEIYRDETVKLFESRGFSVLFTPMIEIHELEVDVGDADYTIITSQTAARIALKRNLIRGKVIAIGSKTGKVVEEMGYEVFLPSNYSSNSLFQEFRSLLKGKRVNLLRSNKGDPILKKLSEICHLNEFKLYRILPMLGAEQKRAVREISEGGVDAVVFSSRMIVESFFENSKSIGIYDEAVKRLLEIPVIAIGPPTAQKLVEHSISPLIPEEYTFDGVLRLLENLRSV